MDISSPTVLYDHWWEDVLVTDIFLKYFSLTLLDVSCQYYLRITFQKIKGADLCLFSFYTNVTFVEEHLQQLVNKEYGFCP